MLFILIFYLNFCWALSFCWCLWNVGGYHSSWKPSFIYSKQTCVKADKKDNKCKFKVTYVYLYLYIYILYIILLIWKKMGIICLVLFSLLLPNAVKSQHHFFFQICDLMCSLLCALYPRLLDSRRTQYAGLPWSHSVLTPPPLPPSCPNTPSLPSSGEEKNHSLF